MRRRALLAAVAGSGAALAGCAESAGPSPTETPPDVKAQTPVSGSVPDLPSREVKTIVGKRIEAAPDAVPDVDAFEAALVERDVDVRELSEKDDFVSLHHAVEAFTAAGVADPLGVVAGVYAAYVPEVDDPTPLSAAVEHAGETAGEYAIATTWAEEYDSGAITAKEYGEMVLGTLKTK
jgi:hypothetical protein